MWYPKKSSNEINNLVACLNSTLGGIYFTVSYSQGGFYTLIMTRKCLEDKRFCNFTNPSERGLKFAEMYYYLIGLHMGLSISKNK